MYKIGELSKLCKIPVRTLRYYNEEGLLIPDMIDKYTGYRYYSASKLNECYKILALKELGFSLEEIKKQIYAKELSDISGLLELKEQELSEVLLQTELQIKRLRAIKEFYKKENVKMFNIIVRNVDSFRIVAIRNIFKDREEASEQIEKIRSELPRAIIGKRNVIINYDTEYCENDFDFMVGVELVGSLPKNCGYTEKHITFSDDVVCLVCKTEERDSAYLRIQQYFEENQYQPIGACHEIYHDDNTVELKTAVCKLTDRFDHPINDDIDLPFVDDPDVVGHWQVIDCIPTKEHFNIKKMKYTGEKLFEEFYFLPNGERYWCFGWTKGYMLSQTGDGNKLQKYEIFELNGEKYMFLEFKSSTYTFYNGKPEYFVLKQTDKKAYTKQEIAISDFIDYPFVRDDKMIGKWESVDFVEKIENFKVGKRNGTHIKLWVECIEFFEAGELEVKFGSNLYRNSYLYRWTKDYMIDAKSSLALQYTIKTIAGQEYLFMQWKSGDYVYGHREPCFYVFRKACS